jgi:hypothetical protein
MQTKANRGGGGAGGRFRGLGTDPGPLTRLTAFKKLQSKGTMHSECHHLQLAELLTAEGGWLKLTTILLSHYHRRFFNATGRPG